MKRFSRLILSITGLLFLISGLLKAQYQMENLDRGIVAVKMAGDGVYVGWRLLASDPASISFNVYRGAAKVNDMPVSHSTNFFDSGGTADDTYHVVPVLDGVEQQNSKDVNPWSQNYHTIPLQRPANGRTPINATYTYSPNDCSVGDLDGDGEYEIVLKWDPSNAKDNSQSGYTGNVYLDGLEMDGTLLWRIDLGKNIRAGAHYTQFMVYDLDGDNKAELACKTADGTVDGKGNVIGDVDADYRNSSGYVLSGPEFFTIFDGLTGEARVTVNYLPARGSVSSWGDNYGNRVDRFLACVAYLDGLRPSVVMCRGYYTRTVLVAWDWRDGQLTNRWIFDSNDGYPSYAGQGNHNLSVGDVDKDGKDEIVYGSIAIDDDGAGLWNSRLGHGDAMHVSDIDPNRPGLEVWGIHENAAVGSALLDARTGKVIWGTGPADVGRGVSANLVESFEGMESWGGTNGLRSCTNQRVGNAPSSANHVIWWDGDLTRELLDGIRISKYSQNGERLLLQASGCSSNNSTKQNPCLQADLFGDWREEVIFRTSDNSALRVYTTTDTTAYRLPTFMHDRVYREAIAWQNVAYNQPPHTSFFVGASMFIPDSLKPPSAPFDVQATALSDTVRLQWEANTEPDLAGYNVYRSIRQNGPFSKLNTILLTETSFLDTDVTNDSTYYYAVTAVDTDANESGYSVIISAIPTVRPPAPIGLAARNDLDAIKILWQLAVPGSAYRIKVYRSQTAGRNYVYTRTLRGNAISFTDINLRSNTTYYYVVTILDSNLVESFFSEETYATTGESFTMQAEDGVTGGTVYLDSNHLGYEGTGFANFELNGASVEFTDLPGFGGGEHMLVYRYALGNTNRTGVLSVNGVERNLTMQSTGEWTNWTLDSTIVDLEPGFVNLIRFESTGSDFGNLDEITLHYSNAAAVEHEREKGFNVPMSYTLHQNYPNPFNLETTISFDLPEPAYVRIDVYDINGRLLTTLTDMDYEAGRYDIAFDVTNIASGVYFVRSRMVSSDVPQDVHVFTRKMVALK